MLVVNMKMDKCLLAGSDKLPLGGPGSANDAEAPGIDSPDMDLEF